MCGQFFHVGVNLVQDVKALLEQSVLGTHEGQHLQETQGDGDGSNAPQGLHMCICQIHTIMLRSQTQEIYRGYSLHPGFQISSWPGAH